MEFLQKKVEQFKQQNRLREAFFREGAAEIAVSNLNILHRCSWTCAIMIALFIKLTPFIIPGWSVTGHYLIFLSVVIVCALGTFFLKKKLMNSPELVTLVCLLFNIVIMGFLIVIDVLPYPELASKFTPLFLVASPVLFSLPFVLMFPFLVGSEVLFAALTLTCKPELVAQNDLFASLAGLTFGIVVCVVVTALRVSDFSTKNGYRHLSQIDTLTGILNKFTFEERVRQYLSTKPNEENCAFLIIDIDNFKQVNDQLGHQAGDQLLEACGRTFSSLFRGSDFFGRFGGDEFVVLMRDVGQANTLNEKCQEIHRAVNALTVPDLTQPVGCSMGAAVTSGRYVAYDDLFRLADDALYEAKAFGKGRAVIHIHSELERAKTDKKLMLIADDNKINRMLLRKVFEQSFDFLEAGDGQETLSLLSQYAGEISVVLLDIVMPVLDGYGVLRYMKSRPATQHIPVLVITADGENEAKALLTGASDIILKPIDPAVARLRVANIMRRMI